MKLNKKLEQLKAELGDYNPFKSKELEYIHNVFIPEFCYNSNAIEGNLMSYPQVSLLLEKGITEGCKEKDIEETLNLRSAFELVLDLVGEDSSINEKNIKLIHSLVLCNDSKNKGIYRSCPVWVYGSDHVPPQPYLVAPMMDSLLQEYKLSLVKDDLVKAISSFHLKFERIHPFVDGNGRTGRLLINFELLRRGFPPIDVLFEDQQRYYSCFTAFDKDKSTFEMELLLEGYLVSALELAIERK